MKKTFLVILLSVIVAASLIALSRCEKKPDDIEILDGPGSVIETDIADNDVSDKADPEGADETDMEELIQPEDNKEADEYEFTTAEMLIDHPLDELISLIGEPNDRSYASSCMGSGEDGELYYTGFTVVTYRENGTETVVDVYKD